MPAKNAEIADLLRRYAGILALEGVDRFKVKAYRRAAETLEAAPRSIATLVAHGGDLQELPGIGKAIAAKIEDIVRTGKLPQLEKATAKLSPAMIELAAKPALDPKKVLRAYKKLGINSLAALQERLDSGELRAALGARMEYHVRQGLDERPRMLLWSAEKLARQVEDFLQAMPSVTRLARVGSLRRRKETVGDLNFLVAGKSTAKIQLAFADFGQVRSAAPRGKHETSYLLSDGRAVSLAWRPTASWGAALLSATGSSAHLAELEALASRKRLKLSNGKKFAGMDEAEIYQRLELQFIEPELREGNGEIEAAANGQLPSLVRLDDLRGDLHMHTKASDGANSLDEMAAAAKKRGYEYIAITDHSQSLKITNGLDEKRLFAHIKAIDKLNARLKGLTVLKSAEVDILADGSLDYSHAALRELDLTICSIHSRFGLNKQQQTERIMRAMDNPFFNILGHATGRLLLKREGYEIDIERILDHAKDRGCYFEINSSPDRLDLSAEHARLAKQRGVKIAINTDAHSTSELGFMSAGINQARRGWLEPADVLNTLPLARLMKQLRR